MSFFERLAVNEQAVSSLFSCYPMIQVESLNNRFYQIFFHPWKW